MNIKNDVNLLVDELHLFYSLACSNTGRPFVVETITMDSNIIPLINIIESERKSENNRQDSPGVKCKSPALSYAVDLVDCTVRNCSNLEFLENYGMILLDFVKNHEIFEPSVSAMFQEMSVYLKPLEIPNVFAYSDIVPVCELIKRSIEFITTFPGDLIMALRIIRHLGISPYNDEDRVPEHAELKFKYIILQFYSLDGIATIMSILDKLTSYFEQPGIHSATLGSIQGVQTTHILLPAVQILRKMLTYVIQCRNVQFKDITAVEILLKTYILMYHIPLGSNGYRDAQCVQQEVIKTFLAYTQPLPLDGVDTDSVHKSLWTQMLSEIIKYTLTGPHTFLPGLLALSELLPLPLPILTKSPITQNEINKLITDRQLWSAHLHPQSALINDLIQTMCMSSLLQLNTLLNHVCLQLADLAPNMTLLVTKSIVDLIITEQPLTSGSANQQLGHLIGFLARLVNHPSIKISVLSVLPGKLIDLLCSVLTQTSSTPAHIKAERNVHVLLQNLLNSDITMFGDANGGDDDESFKRDMMLACSLPSKELVVTIANALIDNFTIDENSNKRLLFCLRTIGMLTEHE